MRVLHVIPSVAPRYGGPSYAVVRYCRALQARGLRVTLASTNADGAGTLPVKTETATEYEGIDARFFERRGEAFKYSSPLATWLRRSIREFDVVHVHAVFSHPSLAAGRMSRGAGVPYIVRPLGSLDPWSLAQRPWRKRVLLWSAAGVLLRHASGLHFTTVGEQQLAAGVAGEVPSRVVPLGVDDEYLHAPLVPPAERLPQIVALTRLDPKKNLAALIRAFHAVSPEFERWRLTIAGTGDVGYAAELRRAAESGSAAARIHFREWLDGDKKLELLRHASAFAVPSHQENFGLSALEAMSCGVPVLAARGVNLAPDIEEAGAGWLCGTSDVEIGVALKEIMHDEVGRHRKAMRARALAARYTWAEAAAQLETWYALLLPALAARGRR